MIVAARPVRDTTSKFEQREEMPKPLIQLGRIIIILGVADAVFDATATVHLDPMMLAIFIFVGVVALMTGKCLKTFDERIARIERLLSNK